MSDGLVHPSSFLLHPFVAGPASGGGGVSGTTRGVPMAAPDAGVFG
jgi:hypothetical protein